MGESGLGELVLPGRTLVHVQVFVTSMPLEIEQALAHSRPVAMEGEVQRLTRLKMPEAIDRQRFLAP